MPKLKSFTLIELLLVIVLIGFISSMSLNLFKENKSINIEELYISLYPNGKLALKTTSNKYHIKITNPIIYDYYNNKLTKKKFEDDIIFEYKVSNGIGDSFILECDEGVYLFKPFWILKFNSIKEIISYEKELLK